MYADNSAVNDHTEPSESRQRWQIITFGTLPSWSEGDAGFQISDHRPIQATLSWQ